MTITEHVKKFTDAINDYAEGRNVIKFEMENEIQEVRVQPYLPRSLDIRYLIGKKFTIVIHELRPKKLIYVQRRKKNGAGKRRIG